MENFEQKWIDLEFMMRDQFGKVPDMEGLLFLIGINEVGNFPEEAKFSKEQKQDLMHVAVCRLLSTKGYFHYDGRDGDGWPHYSKVKDTEIEGINGQEQYLKECIIEYFS